MKKIGVFKVKESFYIAGKGIVIVGHSLEGITRIGAKLILNINDKETPAEVSGIQIGKPDQEDHLPIGLLISFEDEYYTTFLMTNKIQEQIVDVDFVANEE